MPRIAVDDNKRMNLRVSATAKAKLVRAAAYSGTDLTTFVTQSAIQAADALLHEIKATKVNEDDYQRIMGLLENPPKPNQRLREAIAALPVTL